MEKKNHAVAYVDGSYSNNTAGYGVVFFYEDAKEPEYFSGRCKNASMNNVSGEIEASLFAVNKALEYGCSSIDICYDYTGIEYWATGVWRAKKKETMAYRDQMNFFKGMIDIQFHHVEAHTGDRMKKQMIWRSMLFLERKKKRSRKLTHMMQKIVESNRNVLLPFEDFIKKKIINLKILCS